MQTLKIQGNQSLRTGGFGEAIVFYSRAIELTPDNHVLFSNRALAHLKLRQYAKALEDADRCIALNAQFVKAYSTKGTALTWLNRYQEAKAAYAKGASRTRGCPCPPHACPAGLSCPLTC